MEILEDKEFEEIKANRKKVFVKVNFLKIADINTIKEEFTGDVFIQNRWREPSLDGSRDKTVDTSKYWNPKIVISNIQSSSSSKTWSTVKQYDGKAYIIEKRRIKGCFAENLELHEFPFDVQDLSITVSSELSDHVVEIIEDEEKISAVNVMCFVDETEWDICDLVYSEQREFNREISDMQFRNPALLVKCVAKRRAGFFLYNIVLITTMITSFSFTTFSVDTNLTQNRLQLSFIITLTGVTFKMVTNQSLPKIPYLTHLDRLILGSLTFNWLVCIWHAVVSLFEHKSYQNDLDFWAFITFIIVYSIFNIVIFTLIGIKRIIRHYEIEEKEKAYQVKADRIMGEKWKKERRDKRSAWARRNKIDAAGQFRIDDKKVLVVVHFLKITEIDTTKEAYTGEILLHARWHEPELDNAESEEVDVSKFWNPKISVTNVISTTFARKWSHVRKFNGKAFIVEKRRIRGTFAESLELYDFPFDVQDLSVILSSQLSDDVLEIVEDNERICTIDLLCMLHQTEWKISDLVYCEKSIYHREIAEAYFKHPVLLVKCVAKRKAGFFIHNIIVITTMITTLAFTTFSVDVDLTKNRLHIALIITLTSVTFKTVILHTMPRIPYLTHLDRLLVGSMTFTWLICMWHAVISFVKSYPHKKVVDFWAFIGFLVAYVIFFLTIFAMIFIQRHRRKRRLRLIKALYKEKTSRVMGTHWRKARASTKASFNRKRHLDAVRQLNIDEE